MDHMSQVPRVVPPTERPVPETLVVMASTPPSDMGALEPDTGRQDRVETVDIAGGVHETGHEPGDTEHATEEMAPKLKVTLAPETNALDDNSHFAPSEAPAVRSAVVAKPLPIQNVTFTAEPEPATPFTAPAPKQAPPLPRISGRASTRGRQSAATKAKPAASARLAPSSRRLAVSSRRAYLWIIAVIIVVAATVAGIIVFAGGGSPERQHAVTALSEASRQIALARGSVANRQGAQARAAYEAALRELSTSPLLEETAKIPPGTKTFPELSNRAAGIRAEAGNLLAAIRQAEADGAAEANLTALRTRLGRISDAATDLDKLEHDLTAYCQNPVDPSAAADSTAVETYSRLVSEAKLRQSDIVRERERRYVERRVIPVTQVRLKTEGLITDERFGEALTVIEQAHAAHPEADFAPVQQAVNDDAAKAWRSAKAYVDTRLADAKASGTTENQRRASYNAARDRLNQVINRFGLETYVSQAKAILATLP